MTPLDLPGWPMLKPWYRIGWGPDRCILERGGSAVVFEGAAATRLLPSLLPLLDGTRTVEEVAAAIGDAAAPAAENALRLLARSGALTQGPTVRGRRNEGPAAATELLSEAGSYTDGPAAVGDRLAAASVLVHGSGPTADAVSALLDASGVGSVERVEADLAPDRPSPDLVVAAPGPGALGTLEPLNALALELSLPWLQLLPFDGRAALVGPLFVPGSTCCRRCCTLRQESTCGYRDDLAPLADASPSVGVAPPVVAAVAGLGALLALRWLGLGDTRLPGRMLALELVPVPSVSEHVVHRVPRCPVCSTVAGAAAPSPWHEGPAA